MQFFSTNLRVASKCAAFCFLFFSKWPFWNSFHYYIVLFLNSAQNMYLWNSVFFSISPSIMGFLIAQLVKNPPAMQETLVWFLDREIPWMERTGYPFQYSWASLVAQLVKNLPAMQETWVHSLGWKDPLEKGKATHSSILVWRIPWTVNSMRSQRAGHYWATFTFTFLLF